MLSATGFVADAVNRWLLAFSAAVVLVVAGSMLVGRAARRALDQQADRDTHSGAGRRNWAGIAVALGPLSGFAFAPFQQKLGAVTALGAAALALVVWSFEGSELSERVTMIAPLIAAAVAVAFGVRFGPTGVEALDVLGAFFLIVVVTRSADGIATTDGVVGSLGAAAAFGLFGTAAFGHQDGIAAVAAGLAGGCVGLLAFNLPPASPTMGRAGRLAIGFALAVGALALQAGDRRWFFRRLAPGRGATDPARPVRGRRDDGRSPSDAASPFAHATPS